VVTRHYLSFGGGVQSTALLLLLVDRGIDFEAVYADHHTDWPHVAEHVARMQQVHPITVLDTGDLYAECLRYEIMPSRWQRWCTCQFKVEPMRAYYQRPCVVYLGISADEAHRAKASGDPDIEHVYPLVDEGIDRQGCIEIIKAHGLPVPGKSTCYLCPFQSGRDFVRLRQYHPELFERVKVMEQRFVQRRIAAGKEPSYLRDKPIDEIAQEGQLDMFDGWGVHPCLCEV
jgi:hypothetical protein